jgi:hypothetical protein
MRCPRSRVQALAFQYKPKPVIGCMLRQESSRCLNAMGKPAADIIVETLQNAGVRHCHSVMDDTALHGRVGKIWEMVKENFLRKRRLPQ